MSSPAARREGRRVDLRRATADDVATLEAWAHDPAVIAATTDDAGATEAFAGADWAQEIADATETATFLIAEVDGRPVGALQIADPHVEPTHSWGEIEPGLRAIDIWIGDAADRGRGLGAEMMSLAHELCFAQPEVNAIVIDPLESNVRARRFYARLGYVEEGVRLFAEGDRCRVMRLTRARYREFLPR